MQWNHETGFHRVKLKHVKFLDFIFATSHLNGAAFNVYCWLFQDVFFFLFCFKHVAVAMKNKIKEVTTFILLSTTIWVTMWQKVKWMQERWKKASITTVRCPSLALSQVTQKRSHPLMKQFSSVARPMHWNCIMHVTKNTAKRNVAGWQNEIAVWYLDSTTTITNKTQPK